MCVCVCVLGAAAQASARRADGESLANFKEEASLLGRLQRAGRLIHTYSHIVDCCGVVIEPGVPAAVAPHAAQSCSCSPTGRNGQRPTAYPLCRTAGGAGAGSAGLAFPYYGGGTLYDWLRRPPAETGAAGL